ncbi:MAG: SWIM zinc finger family protein [Limnospira sp.]
MRHPTIAPAAKMQFGVSPSPLAEPQFPQITPLVSRPIKIETIDSIGIGETPRLVYSTPEGRWSRLISKAEFNKIWSLYLKLKGLKDTLILKSKINKSGVHLQTQRVTICIAQAEAKSFLSRYNRVAIAPLQVRLIPQGAVVWNENRSTLSLVKDGECTCEDWRYRQTICKHQIAAELCRSQSR